MSGIDPDIQAAFGSAPVSQPTTPQVDADIEAAFKPAATSVTVPSKLEQEAEDERAAETGAGEVALHLGTGAAAAIPAGVAYLGGALGIGKGSLENARAVQQTLTYQPRTEQGQGALKGLGMVAGAPGRWATKQIDTDIEPSGQLSAALSDVAERTMDVAPFLGEGIAAFKGGGLTRAIASPKEVPKVEPHPLQGAADTEAANLKAHATAAEAEGLKLPGREVSAPQQYMDNTARRDLNLPGNSPVTSGILDAADKLNVSPHYAAAEKFAPELVQASQQGRSVARGLFDDASNMNLTFAQRSAARTEAQANYQAAKNAEAEFRAKATAAGQQELADNWDTARIYKAKLEAWRDALDGAGHVIGPKIRKLGLSDEPLSGPQKEAASVAAQYPELFRGTQLQTPRPGIISRVIRRGAPLAGAAVGGYVAPGVVGPVVGAELASEAANRLTR